MCDKCTLSYALAIVALSSVFGDKLQLVRFTLKVAAGVKTIGVWGDYLNSSVDGICDKSYEREYLTCNYSDMRADGLSFDQSTNNLYLNVHYPNGARDIFEMSLCPNAPQQVSYILRNVRIVEHNIRHPMFTKCEWKCRWGPLYVHEGRIYFIMSHIVGTRRNPRRHVELRRLEGCDESLQQNSNHTDRHMVRDADILSCSRLLCTLHTDTTRNARRRWPKVWPSGALKVTRLEDGTETAFVLLVNSTDNVSMALIQVTLDNATMCHRLLHSMPADESYSHQLRVESNPHGAIDYHKGTLCYLMADQLVCGVYGHPADHFQPVKVLKSGEAVEAGICKAGGSLIRRTQLAGLAISKTPGLLAVFFSCQSFVLGYGHVGVVRMSHYGLQKQLLPVVHHDRTPVLAGQLVVTTYPEELDACDTEEQQTTRPTTKRVRVEYDIPDTVGIEISQTTIGSSAGQPTCVVTLVVMLIFLIFFYV